VKITSICKNTLGNTQSGQDSPLCKAQILCTKKLADRLKKVHHFVFLHVEDPFPRQHLYLVHIWTIPRMLMLCSLQYVAAKRPCVFHTYCFICCQQDARCFI